MSEIEGFSLRDGLACVEVGEAQEHGRIIILPLMGGGNGVIEYLTLAEALAGSHIKITEVDTEGSVPELKVINGADQAVLLLDGEELAGAKQNRILNATILLQEKSDTTIPVSCTESGRWSYRGPVFSDSGHISPHTIRKNKLASVNAALSAARGFTSDQAKVWEDIDHLQAAAGFASPTRAMRDVLEARRESIAEYMEAFPAIEGQRGLLAVIDGSVVGFDLLSRPASFANLHKKLVGSYVMDALCSDAASCAEGPGKAGAAGVAKASPGARALARGFLDLAAGCEGQKHKSIGYGWDFRYQASSLVGSALVHEGEIIHAAFFRTVPEPDARGNGLAAMRVRRGNRMGG